MKGKKNKRGIGIIKYRKALRKGTLAIIPFVDVREKDDRKEVICSIRVEGFWYQPSGPIVRNQHVRWLKSKLFSRNYKTCE